MTQIIPENCDPEFDNDYFYLGEKIGDDKNTIEHLEHAYKLSQNRDKYIIYKPYVNDKGEYKEAYFTIK